MAFGLSAGAVSLIGMGVGALAGGQSSTKTAEQAPWAPAQDWMKSNIARGQQLQDYYQKNPFNDQQKTSYNNLFSDTNNFRQNVAPGLMDFANKAMGSSYERQRGGAPGSGGGYGGAVQPGGMSTPQNQPSNNPIPVGNIQQTPQQNQGFGNFGDNSYAGGGFGGDGESGGWGAGIAGGEFSRIGMVGGGGLLGSTGRPFSVAPGQSLSPLGAGQNPYANGAITAPATDPNKEMKSFQEKLLDLNRGGDGTVSGWV